MVCWTPDASADDDTVVVDEEEPEAPYFPELRAAPRKLIGFDFGIGVFDGFCAGCAIQGGISADFFAGAQVARRVAIVLDLWSLLHLLPTDSAEERGFTAHTLATACGRFWATPTLWLQAGLGGGFLSVVGTENAVAIGPAASLVIGSELKHNPTSGIDLSIRVGSTRFRLDGEVQYIYNLSAVVGYHWN